MDEGERRGVEGVPVERNRQPRAGLAVHLVADDRMAERRQMDADLVGTPCLETNLEQRKVLKPLEHPITGDGPFAAASRANGHLHPVPRMASDRRSEERRVGKEGRSRW